ncbi:hypothetical protein Micbo1qcDRAFT_176223 [Microdochium bolleyi]|uniref:Hydrophobin n=1 Tax=Microdochium bolleyi TaxID=196109 RepID=A0A136IZS5_9PEZI|nr:hypothetical protein Micbo1qcDRAFT_176223 [Microdochium bolleyi]
MKVTFALVSLFFAAGLTAPTNQNTGFLSSLSGSGNGNGNGNGNTGNANGNTNGNSNNGGLNGNFNGNTNEGSGNGVSNGNINQGSGNGNINGNENMGYQNGVNNGVGNAGTLNGNANGNNNDGIGNGQNNGNTNGNGYRPCYGDRVPVCCKTVQYGSGTMCSTPSISPQSNGLFATICGSSKKSQCCIKSGTAGSSRREFRILRPLSYSGTSFGMGRGGELGIDICQLINREVCEEK